MKTIPAVRELALVATLALSFLASSASAGVIVVNASGGGQFTSIQPAVNAAVDGDTLLVKGGTYAGFSIIDKTLTVVGDPGALNVDINGAVIVNSLATSRSVILAKLNVNGLLGDAYALYVSGNSGEVRVQDCALRGSNGNPNISSCSLTSPHGRSGAYVVSGSGGVVFVRCTISGGNCTNAVYWCCCDNGEAGGNGIDVDGCRVAFFDCTVYGGRGGDQGCHGGRGGTGCRAVSTTGYTGVSFSGSNIVGGGGGIGNDYICALGGAGGDGLVLSGAQAWLLFSTTYGGVGGYDWTNHTYGPNGAAISGGGYVDFGVPGHLKLQMPSVARENTVVYLTFNGPPGSSMWLMKSSSSPFLPMPGWRGVLLTAANRWDFQWLGPMPPGGQYQMSYFVQPLPAGVESERRYFQPFLVDPNGAVQLGSFNALTILDSAY